MRALYKKILSWKIWLPGAVIMGEFSLAAKIVLLMAAIIASAVWLAGQAAAVAGAELVWSVFGITLAISGYAAVGLCLSIESSLSALRRHMIAMSMGDLRTEIKFSGKDEIGQLLRELSHMQNGLRDTVKMVLDSSSSVVDASVEIASGAQDLSARVESAAAALEESSAALEQSSSTTLYTADAVAKASGLALDNAHVAQRGEKVVQDVVDTMEKIQASSNKINDIIGVIDSIAFQTNILSLNAAVEAASAKEHGKGFAVVAGEVRNLAKRCATSAQEVKDLIRSSVSDINQGVRVVHGAGDAMREIVSKSDMVRQLMEDVARAAKEQAEGIAQVDIAIQQLDRHTQANAALVEQTAATANSQRDAAVRMAAMVEEFRLPGAIRRASKVEGLDMDQYIDAHRQWKVKLRDAIEARLRVDTASLKRDDCCELGKWIHGNGDRRFANSKVFSELLARHREFHERAGDVGELINACHYAEAEDALAPGTPYSDATREVVRVLSFAKRFGFLS